MSSEQQPRITIDDIIESATQGVLRAMEARNISGRDFTQQNGFNVRIDITAGGFPGGPIERFGGKSQITDTSG